MASGGSFASASVTCAATTPTVQVVPDGSVGVGSSTKLVAGPAPVVLVNATGVATGHSSVKAVPVTLTGSLNVIEMLVLPPTFVAPLTGTVDATLGAASVANAKL